MAGPTYEDRDRQLRPLNLAAGAPQVTTDALPARKVASGTKLVNGGTTDVLGGPFTRRPGEVVWFAAFVQEDVGGADWPSVISGDDVVITFVKTGGGADVYALQAQNLNLLAGRTVDWIIFAATP